MELALVMVLVVCGVALIGYAGLAQRPGKDGPDKTEDVPSGDTDAGEGKGDAD